MPAACCSCDGSGDASCSRGCPPTARCSYGGSGSVGCLRSPRCSDEGSDDGGCSRRHTLAAYRSNYSGDDVSHLYHHAPTARRSYNSSGDADCLRSGCEHDNVGCSHSCRNYDGRDDVSHSYPSGSDGVERLAITAASTAALDVGMTCRDGLRVPRDSTAARGSRVAIVMGATARPTPPRGSRVATAMGATVRPMPLSAACCGDDPLWPRAASAHDARSRRCMGAIGSSEGVCPAAAGVPYWSWNGLLPIASELTAMVDVSALSMATANIIGITNLPLDSLLTVLLAIPRAIPRASRTFRPPAPLVIARGLSRIDRAEAAPVPESHSSPEDTALPWSARLWLMLASTTAVSMLVLMKAASGPSTRNRNRDPFLTKLAPTEFTESTFLQLNKLIYGQALDHTTCIEHVALSSTAAKLVNQYCVSNWGTEGRLRLPGGDEIKGFDEYDYVQGSLDPKAQSEDTAMMRGEQLAAARRAIPGLADIESAVLRHASDHHASSGRRATTIGVDGLRQVRGDTEVSSTFKGHLDTWSFAHTKPSLTYVVKVSTGSSRMRIIGAQPFDYDEVAGSAACFPSGAGHESLAAEHDDIIYKMTIFVAFDECDHLELDRYGTLSLPFAMPRADRPAQQGEPLPARASAAQCSAPATRSGGAPICDTKASAAALGTKAEQMVRLSTAFQSADEAGMGSALWRCYDQHLTRQTTGSFSINLTPSSAFSLASTIVEERWLTVLWIGGGDGFEALLAALTASSRNAELRVTIVEREPAALTSADTAVRRVYAAIRGKSLDEAAALDTKEWVSLGTGAVRLCNADAWTLAPREVDLIYSAAEQEADHGQPMALFLQALASKAKCLAMYSSMWSKAPHIAAEIRAELPVQLENGSRKLSFRSMGAHPMFMQPPTNGEPRTQLCPPGWQVLDEQLASGLGPGARIASLWEQDNLWYGMTLEESSTGLRAVHDDPRGKSESLDDLLAYNNLVLSTCVAQPTARSSRSRASASTATHVEAPMQEGLHGATGDSSTPGATTMCAIRPSESSSNKAKASNAPAAPTKQEACSICGKLGHKARTCGRSDQYRDASGGISVYRPSHDSEEREQLRWSEDDNKILRSIADQHSARGQHNCFTAMAIEYNDASSSKRSAGSVSKQVKRLRLGTEHQHRSSSDGVRVSCQTCGLVYWRPSIGTRLLSSRAVGLCHA